MKKVFLFVFILAFQREVSAQNQQKIDSLNKLFNSNIHDTIRVKIFLEGFATEYYLTDPTKAIAYCRQAKDIAERINYINGISSSYGWLAYLHEQQGNIAEALICYTKSLELFRKQKNKKEEATVLNNMAAIYKDRGDLVHALQYNYKSLSIKKQINDREGIATTYNNLGLIYSNQGNIKLAITYYDAALKIYESINDSTGIATALNNMGGVYKEQGQFAEAESAYLRALSINQKTSDKYGEGYSLNSMGVLCQRQQNFAQALEYYRRALSIRQQIDDKQGVAYSLKNIGTVYIIQKNDSADYFYNKSLQLFKEVDDKWGIAVTEIMLGNSLFNQSKLTDASALAENALQLTSELGFPADIRDAALLLATIHRKKQQWKEALQFTDLYHTMRDSVVNTDNRKVALQQQIKYVYDRKEADLKAEQDKKDAISKAELHQQKTEKYAYLVSLSLILIFSIVLFNRFRITRKQNILIEKTNQQLSATLTELKSTQQQLLQSEKMAAFGTMATRMAHEIQNPLNFVNNFAELSNDLVKDMAANSDAASRKEDEQTLINNLQKIKHHGQRAQSIVNQLQQHIKEGTAHLYFEEDGK